MASMLSEVDEIIIYGFTSVLWQVWGATETPAYVRRLLAEKNIAFVHSGGWKKMEALSVGRAEFDSTLLSLAKPGSLVLDFYGLVEQVGIIYPLCPYGKRHVPVWADVVVRDPHSLQPVHGEIGLLGLMNSLAWGAEDQSRVGVGSSG